jgi:AraC-like DNA-binding protein
MYLLREEQPTITEIAFEVGFQSLSQFNRTFRALTGMAPGEFRRKELGAFVK